MKRFVISLLLTLLLVGCAAEPALVTPETTNTPEVTAEQTPKIEAAPIPTPEPEPTPEATPGRDPIPVIAGSQVYDIVLSLQDKGIPKPETQPLRTVNEDPSRGYNHSSSGKYSGFKIGYFINSDIKHTVSTANFSIHNSDSSIADFITCASDFLGYCATMPYDTSDPDAAKAWVKDNIERAIEGGDEITESFGDAEYCLYGDQISIDLVIEAPGYTAYVLALQLR